MSATDVSDKQHVACSLKSNSYVLKRGVLAKAVMTALAASIISSAALVSSCVNAVTVGKYEMWYESEHAMDDDLYNLTLKNSTMYVPAPDPNVNYAATTRFSGHGNLHTRIPDHETVAAGDDENPLASPYYDPITGKVNKPARVEAEERRQRALEESQRRMNEQQIRLAQYDTEQRDQRNQDPNYKPFGDFFRHDRIYKRLPETANIFFLENAEDGQRLIKSITEIENDLNAELAFVLMDENGIVALKDNRDYPLYGMSKFHLAYAVGSLMSARADGPDRRISFDVSELNRSVYSPLVEILFSKVGRDVLDPTGKLIGQGNRTNRNQRTSQLSAAVKAFQTGNTSSARAEARKYSGQRGTYDQYNQDISDLENADSRRMSLSINDLMQYSLGHSDSNASRILLSYIGNLASLEIFSKTKGLERVHFKHSEVDTYMNPNLVYENAAPLYESAKLMGTYFQDDKISHEVRNFIDDIMYFNVSSQKTIQKGVRNALRNEIDSSRLRIFSREGVGGFMEGPGHLSVVSDLAYIEWKGHHLVMAVSVRNIKGTPSRAQRIAEKTIAYTARALMEYQLYRVGKGNTPPVTMPRF